MKTNQSKYPQNSGFKIPKDYFGNLEEKMMLRLEDQKSIEIPPKGKEFSVPDGYFSSLEDKIIAKTYDENTRVRRLFKKEYFFYAAAVAAIFVLMLGNFFKTGTNQPLGWDDIEISAMENYIDEGYDMGYFELSSAEYSDYVFENGKLIDDSDFNTVNSDAVFDYIDKNIEDPAYILE
ncbi:hypothetical protein [Christiangramia forsetii]|uniref:Uncharacterized protein n=2 Tax=Christiangramia forsetii TaxID=411153 RepID=A0M084_CHRFK|nr:hypothetical protein [Christiangramia forsetii]GGG41577.1 hypothetical protein GCM10011532_26630 [Christiangramia forsetii]CAL66029.1 hypothetical protein GFO_1055 [Christiangramia forsetii KT0803]